MEAWAGESQANELRLRGRWRPVEVVPVAVAHAAFRLETPNPVVAVVHQAFRYQWTRSAAAAQWAPL